MKIEIESISIDKTNLFHKMIVWERNAWETLGFCVKEKKMEGKLFKKEKILELVRKSWMRFYSKLFESCQQVQKITYTMAKSFQFNLEDYILIYFNGLKRRNNYNWE